MALNLAKPPAQYDQAEQMQNRHQLEQEDKKNRKIGNDVEIGNQRLILKSPDGTRWNVTVADDGTLDTTAL